MAADAQVASVTVEQWGQLWVQWGRWLQVVQAGSMQPSSNEEMTRCVAMMARPGPGAGNQGLGAGRGCKQAHQVLGHISSSETGALL